MTKHFQLGSLCSGATESNRERYKATMGIAAAFANADAVERSSPRQADCRSLPMPEQRQA